jgi:sialic acid synthase SpsE
LIAIPYLKQKLQCLIGYSDHTLGVEAATLSVALGARIVEKHFTINKNYSDFRDHQLSADPLEMSQLIQRIKDISTLLGVEGKFVQKGEIANITAIRRCIVASRNLVKGHIIGPNDITWVRVLGGGISPGREHMVLGRTLSCSIQMGDPITIESFVE